MMQNITHVLFDLGNVLVELNGMPFLRHLYPNLADREIHEKWLSLKSVENFERGRSSPQAFLVEAPQEMNLKMSPIQFGEMYASWLVGAYGGAVELVQSLKRGYRVGCLSNTNEIHMNKLRSQGSLLSEFHDAFLSYEMGVLKPWPEAFVHVLKAWGAEAENVLFLDDSQDNIRAASGVGMNAVKVFGFNEVRSACSVLLSQDNA